MKKLGLGCAVATVAIAIFVGIILFATSGVAGAADDFVAHLAAKEIDQAYALLGPEVVEDLPRDRFEGWLSATKLDQAKSGSWTSRNVNNGEGEIKGNLTLEDGSKKPIVFILAKLDGEWRIQGIQFDEKTGTDDSDSSANSAVKARAELFVELVRNAQLEKAYAMIGEKLRVDLNEASFGPFVQETGLGGVTSAEWDEPKVNGSEAQIEAVLTKADEQHLAFRLILQTVDGEWMIQGFNIKPLEGLSELPVPTEAEAVKMVADLQEALDTYAETQDDSKVMALCHATLRYQLEDTEKGLPAFLKSFPDPQSFRELLKKEPKLVEPPKKSMKYGATIKSKTDSLPNGKFLTTELELGVEDNQWKLTSFQVNTRTP